MALFFKAAQRVKEGMKPVMSPLSLLLLALLVLLSVCLGNLTPTCQAFVPPLRPKSNAYGHPSRGGLYNFRNSYGQGDEGGNLVPPSGDQSDRMGGYDQPIQAGPILAVFNASNLTNIDTVADNVTVLPVPVRGGGGSNVVTSSLSYWKGALESIASSLVAPFKGASKAASSLFKSKQVKFEQELMEQLKTMPVRRVTVPNSTVLPTDVIQIAAKRSGVLGSPLKSDAVQELAATLKRWYLRQGYILHSVTGATLKADTGTAEISVQEPLSSTIPVGITFYKQMVVDESTGDLLTLVQYKDRLSKRNGASTEIQTQDLNTTLVETQGRTKPSRIAAAMSMQPGQPFYWDAARWSKVTGSGIFSRDLLQATPRHMRDGTVQLHIMAQEAPARHLEYGLGKSLYTGGWEGELDFEHANLLGGAETLGLSVRRGAHNDIPSVRLKFSNGRLGLDGGYDVEAFSEFIQDNGAVVGAGELEQPAASTDNNPQAAPAAASYDCDVLTSRRGTTFRVKNPIDPKTIRNSVASASLERTSTKTGLHETVGSTTMDVGPFFKELSLGARSNIDASFTAGTRIARDSIRSLGTSSTNAAADSTERVATNILPYGTLSGTTRQLFPLLGGGSPTNPVSSSSGKRPLILALKHSAILSTKKLPRHVAKMIGTSCNIRGAVPNDRVSCALRGTTELRVPIQLPARLVGSKQDASVVVYGDWLLATRDSLFVLSSPSKMLSNTGGLPLIKKSSVGFGVRKSIQGIPLQYDVSYDSEHGKVKALFGLGKDFVF